MSMTMAFDLVILILMGGIYITNWQHHRIVKQTLEDQDVRMQNLEDRLDVHADWIGQKASVSELEIHVARATGLGRLGRRDIGGKAPREG